MRSKPFLGVPFNRWIFDKQDWFERKIEKLSTGLHGFLYKSSPNHLISFKTVTSILPGYFVFRIISYILSLQYPFPKDLQSEIHYSLLLIVMCSYLLSVQVRAITWLILPHFLIGYGLLFCWIFIIVEVFSKFHYLHQNFLAVIHILICIFKYSKFAFLWNLSLNLFFNSLADINKALFSARLRIRPLTKFASSRFKMSGDIYEDISFSDVNLQEACRNYTLQFWENCRLKARIVFFWILFCYYTYCSWGCWQIASHYVTKACDELLKMGQEFNKSEELKKEMKIEKVLGENRTEIPKWPDMESVYDDYEQQYNSFSGLFTPYFSGFMQVLMIFLIMRAFMQTLRYHQIYLNDLSFDNFYIDRYFCKIDERRRKQNKTHLLPLSGKAKDTLVYLFSSNTSVKEESQFMFYFFYILLWFIFIIVYLAAQFLADYAFILSEVIQVQDISETASLKYNLSFIGYQNNRNPNSSTLAGKLNDMFKMSFTENRTICEYGKNFLCTLWTVHFTDFDFTSCYVQPVPFPNSELIDCSVKLFLLLLAQKFKFVIRRIRHMICDYFYYRHSKRRILYMYNHHLGIKFEAQEATFTRVKQMLQGLSQLRESKSKISLCRHERYGRKGFWSMFCSEQEDSSPLWAGRKDIPKTAAVDHYKVLYHL